MINLFITIIRLIISFQVLQIFRHGEECRERSSLPSGQLISTPVKVQTSSKHLITIDATQQGILILNILPALWQHTNSPAAFP